MPPNSGASSACPSVLLTVPVKLPQKEVERPRPPSNAPTIISRSRPSRQATTCDAKSTPKEVVVWRPRQLACRPEPPTHVASGRLLSPRRLSAAIEWYDFYIFGRLRRRDRAQFSPPKGHDTLRCSSTLATFAAGFAARPFGALVFGRIGDLVEAQIRLPCHAADYGRRDRADRPSANLCDDRSAGPDHPGALFGLCRAGAGWRVWRRGGVCGRTCCRTTGAVSTPALSRSLRRWACLCR